MSTQRPLLLVVDDEPEVLRSLHDLFRREFRVLTFERGDSALEALDGIDPPVIMSDQRMPEMSGVEFLRRAKQMRPDSTRLLFTGYAEIKAVIDAINEGNIFRYVTKPWDPEELATVVRQAVEHHDLIVERRRLVAELQESNARLLEADRLQRAFIEVAGHELNTPVAVVQGMAELWMLTQGAKAAPAERAWIERIQASARRLARTVERMLKLLHSGRLDEMLELGCVALEPIVRRVVGDVTPFLEARGQQVDLLVASDLGEAEVDPAKVGDILSNLLVNAIKFTPDAGRIILRASAVGADAVRFEVEDTGSGISDEERPHLFKPFFTGYDTLHHSSGDFQHGKRGIGLGLCLVKRFVELHGGRIDVRSTPGEGATFAVELPRRATLRPTVSIEYADNPR